MNPPLDGLPSYHGREVLVTGGAGAIGGHLVRALVSAGANVTVLDDLSSGFRTRLPHTSQIKFVRGSVTHRSQLRRVFETGPAVVFHLAALFANQNSVEHPERDLRVNGLGTLRVLQESVRHNVERFIYAASSSSHPRAGDSGCNEPGRLATPYQITKLLGEMYCRFFSEHHGLHVCAARLFNAYGPGELPGPYRNVIPNWIYLALQQKPLRITGTGRETRDFTFVSDLVEGLMLLGALEVNGAPCLDLGTGEETTILELARAINALTSNPSPIEYVPARKWDHQVRRGADLTQACALIGYKPRIPLHLGLKRTVNWFQTNWKRIQVSASAAMARLEKRPPAPTPA
ncbi:MAG: NAD-dependent epimerase/dehydratase family protein [Verrucomicrobiota bacterium]